MHVRGQLTRRTAERDLELVACAVVVSAHLRLSSRYLDSVECGDFWRREVVQCRVDMPEHP